MTFNKKSLLFALLALLTLSLVGCTGLNEEEQFILESVLAYSEDFKVPPSVRLYDVQEIAGDNDRRPIIIQARNSHVTPAVQSNHILITKEDGAFSRGHIFELTGESTQHKGIQDKEIDLRKINNAIEDHWKDQGVFLNCSIK